MPLERLSRHATLVTRILKAMANTRRLKILCSLTDNERSVTDLQHEIGISQSALSQHLARLRRDNLVTTRRDAQHVYYALSEETSAALLKQLDSMADDFKAAFDRAAKEKTRIMAAE